MAAARARRRPQRRLLAILGASGLAVLAAVIGIVLGTRSPDGSGAAAHRVPEKERLLIHACSPS